MKTRLLNTAALVAALASLSLVRPVDAQQPQTHCTNPNPYPSPYPNPAPSSYFLGVYTSTVSVDTYGGGNGGGQQPAAARSGVGALVVPGYGETVYGQRINQIVPNSPAFHAGLEPGDVIVDANGVPMDSKEDLVAAVQASQGYLEMKVLDARSGQLVWVVAQTDPQGTNPVLAARNQPNNNGPVFRTQQQPSGGKLRNNGGNLTRQLDNQIRSTVEMLGGRRPPVRRNR